MRSHITQLFLLLLIVSNDLSAAPIALKKHQIAKIKVESASVTCGYIKSKWNVVKKSGSKYEVKSSASRKQKTACGKLLKLGAAKNLSQFPSTGSLVKSASLSQSNFSTNAVVGTPPTLEEIVSSGGEDIFWRPGVVSTIGSGTPDQATCSEFFGGSDDGTSGGFGACYLTEGVGYSVGEIIRAGTSLCYMKNAGSQQGAESGAIQIASGTVEGGVRNLFSTPSGSQSRTIKVSTSGEEGESTMFIRVASASENERDGNQYKFEFWACEGNQSSPQEYEVTRITSGGEFKSKSIHTFGQNGIGESNTSGFLSRSGSSLIFDTTRERTATFGGSQESVATNFKGHIVINGQNQIFSKVHDTQGEHERKGYSVARFDGSGLSTLRFYEGAFKEEQQFGEFSNGIEYRDAGYRSSPQSEYITFLDQVNFSTDEFYTESFSAPTIPSRASCTTTPDVVAELDMSSEFMQSIAQECEGERIDGDIQFCRSEALETAQQRYNNVCQP